MSQSKFIGRRASRCRKCGGAEHYVNRLGGISCSVCVVPKTAEDIKQKLTIEGGIWIDPSDRFDLIDVPAATVAAASASSAAASASAATALINAHHATSKQPKNLPVSSLRPAYSRGQGGELSEAELELFSNPAIWELPANRDLIIHYGGSLVYVSEMFTDSEDADRERGEPDARTLKTKMNISRQGDTHGLLSLEVAKIGVGAGGAGAGVANRVGLSASIPTSPATSTAAVG